MSSFKILSNSIKLLRKSVFKFVASFLCNFDYKLLGFFIVYGTSFQTIFFLLNRISSTPNQYRNNFLAGFLAGTTFYLSPRYFLFTYAFTTFIEVCMIMYNHFKWNLNSNISYSWFCCRVSSNWIKILKLQTFWKMCLGWKYFFVCQYQRLHTGEL